jgi:hypothetical protein
MFIGFKNVLGKLVTYYNNVEVCTDEVWMSHHSYALQRETNVMVTQYKYHYHVFLNNIHI